MEAATKELAARIDEASASTCILQSTCTCNTGFWGKYCSKTCTNAKLGEEYTSGSGLKNACGVKKCAKAKTGYYIGGKGACVTQKCTNAKKGQYYSGDGGLKNACPVKACTNKVATGQYYSGPAPYGSQNCPLAACKKCDEGSEHTKPGSCECEEIAQRDYVVVSGAGYTEANGVYTYAGTYLGYPAYCKGTGLKPTDKFTIKKCGWNGGCGLLMWQSTWGWGIGCAGHHRYSDPDCKEQDPTLCNWEDVKDINPRKGYATYPIPAVHEFRSEMIVSGGGYAKGNGVYTYAGTYNKFPAYCKGTGLKPTDSFAIAKCGWNTGCGLVMWGSHWGWGIGCDGHHRYSDPDCKEQDPTNCDWKPVAGMNPRPSYAKNPLPQIAHLRYEIEVSGAEYSKSNGMYTYAGTYNNYPAYCKGTDLKPTDKFTIAKCGWNGGCGLVRWASTWGWGIGCEGHHRYSDPGCLEMDPSRCKWAPLKNMNPRAGYASGAIPKVHQLVIEKHIIVSGSGWAKADGLYTYSGTYNGYPAYCKGTDLKPTQKFSIGKCGWSGGCGLVFWQSYWGWGIGCDGHHRYADRGCKKFNPADCLWEPEKDISPRKNYASGKVPSVTELRKEVVVSEGGYKKGNGVYKFSGVYNGFPAYCKGTDLKPTDKFTISKCGWNTGCGLVMWSSTWGWGTGCDGHHRYADPGCKEQDPTKCAWGQNSLSPRPNYATTPIPRVGELRWNILVSGGQYKAGNGVYTYSGIYNGYPAYCKGTNLKPTDTFTISKCGWSSGCGLVMWSSHWGWGIGCAGHHRYADPGCKERDPTKCKWAPKNGFNPRPSYAGNPIPKVGPVQNQIVVSNGGYNAGNGVYTFAGIYNQFPAYCKGTDLKPTQTFSIGKCGWNGGCGLVMWSSHWGWGIGCAGHHRYADPGCKEQNPTKCKWAPNKSMNPRPSYATNPIPVLSNRHE